MIIKDVITLAKYGELAGVASKNNDDAIVAFINLGMIELHTRFPLKVEEAIVNLLDGTTYYDMPSNFMYPLEAFGEAPINSPDTPTRLPINDEDNPLSIFFNDWNTAQITSSTTGSHISIIYVAKPTPITLTQSIDGVTELDLADSLIDCLLSYIGYRAHIGVKSDSRSENNAHWQRFERNCKKAEELGVAFPSDSMNMSTRIFNRGFV